MSAERPLVGCALHDGADIDACGCPALDSPGAIAYRGLLVKARAEIARLTAELAAARAVPADVEAAIDRLDMYADPFRSNAVRAAVAQAISEASTKRCPACCRDTCPRHGHTFTGIMDHAAAASDCEAHAATPPTVGGLLATAREKFDAVEFMSRTGNGEWVQVNGARGKQYVRLWLRSRREWVDVDGDAALLTGDDYAQPARLVPARLASDSPESRGPLPKGG